VALQSGGDDAEPVHIVVGLSRALRALLMSRLAAPSRLHCLYSVHGSQGVGLEFDGLHGEQALEAFADLAPCYELVTVLLLPYCHLPERVQRAAQTLRELGANILEPQSGEGLWPSYEARGAEFDQALVNAICVTLGGRREAAASVQAPEPRLEIRERATLLSILRGLVSHTKLGPNNHSHEDDLWKSRGAHLKAGEKKGLLSYLLRRKIVARKHNKSIGGTGWVYWVDDVVVAVSEFPELEALLGGVRCKEES
jgi:hypothetical protein